MGDNPSSTESGGDSLVNLSAGMRLPFFRKGRARPRITSASDINLLVAVCNAFLNLKVNIGDAQPDSDGNIVPSAKFTVSNQNAILDLLLGGGGAGGSSGIVPMQVVSYTTTNEYLSAQMGSFTAANTFTATGGAMNVALPWELRPGDIGYVNPAYAVGDIIYVLETSAGENGVYVGGSELTLMDLGLGRVWESKGIFTLGTMHPDYFIGTDVATGLSVAIAKSYKLQNSRTSAVIDGVTWSYTYETSGSYDYLSREATATISGSGVTEYQAITPRFISGDHIQAYMFPTGLLDASSNPIVWQDSNADGRAWTRMANQGAFE